MGSVRPLCFSLPSRARTARSSADCGAQFHGSDNVYGSRNLDLVDFFVRFAHTLDPNVGAPRTGAVHWPRYSSASPALMTFLDGAVPLALSNGTYMSEGFELLTQLTLEPPF